MSINLPAYSKQIAEAHEVFRGDVIAAHEVFEKEIMLSAENLDEKLRVLRVQFFDDEEDRAVEATPSKKNREA